MLLAVVAATGCGALPPATETETSLQASSTDSVGAKQTLVDAPPCTDECYLSMRQAGCLYRRCTKLIPAQRGADGRGEVPAVVYVRPGECRVMWYECVTRCYLHDPATIAACKTIGGCHEDYWRAWRQGLDACSLDPDCTEAEFVEASLSPRVKLFPCQ